MKGDVWKRKGMSAEELSARSKELARLRRERKLARRKEKARERVIERDREAREKLREMGVPVGILKTVSGVMGGEDWCIRCRKDGYLMLCKRPKSSCRNAADIAEAFTRGSQRAAAEYKDAEKRAEWERRRAMAKDKKGRLKNFILSELLHEEMVRIGRGIKN